VREDDGTARGQKTQRDKFDFGHLSAVTAVR
jgi:hypothetical protein